MMDKVHVYMCWHIASIKSTAGNKTSFFPFVQMNYIYVRGVDT